MAPHGSRNKELSICGIAKSQIQQVPSLPTQPSHDRNDSNHEKQSQESNLSPSQHTRDEMQSDSSDTLQKDPTSTSTPSQIPSCFLPLPMSSGDQTWGLGTERKAGADQAIATKMAHFHNLKTQGMHFNHTLAQNRSFHNPHINDKLVNWVGLDETGTNFPTLADVGSNAISWDPKNPSILQEGRAQKSYDESRELHAKNRSQVDFQPARHDSKRSRRHTTQPPPSQSHER